MNAWILDAARTLFDQHGYHGVTRDDVCREAGTSLTTLHNHFISKQALAVAAFAPYVQAVIESIETSVRETPEVKAREFIIGLSAALIDHPAMAVALLPLSRDPRNAGPDEELVVTLRQLAEFLGTLLDLSAIGIKCKPPTADVAEFYLSGLLTWIVHHPGGSHLDAAELVLGPLSLHL
ncbi:TetR/AcrR family transcriptional regulator [Streptomyces griseoaurantiacus]|uniref:TetR/AcrR family transcriptional regulator n=1 Tax=Streptomyces griseoaurantiacus TaxID=68213 RepID=UPI003677CC73